ncbi:hypothetical protein [uncultured Cetobacterium sp.]|uniref:hypothetical protein n=1 Tax=uncultured Cetobacterium sp. TaxID=527638 RepID=UPI00260DC68C|nr:hypothetical protein [uncultured Cetobacterium sp.]
MSKKISKKKVKAPWWEEIIDTPETEVIEENIYLDEKFIKNKELVRIDMNIIQFPIFSKNTRRKVNQIVKYYFNQNRDTYITVKPSSGDYIPGEGEEKVFIALMQIMKEKGMPRKFIVTAGELKEKLNLKTKRYIYDIKKSLLRLSETNYNFKNTMYSSEKKGVLNEEISTPILTLRIITLCLEENQKYRDIFDDKRVKEIYEIEISEHFYKNIITKGYLVYNGNTLLGIESTIARTIYMFVEKLRFDNLYLKLDTLHLIKRIPLKHNKSNLSRTIDILEKSFEELKLKKLIDNYNFIKESTWEKSEIEIFFHEVSILEKQDRFYDDRNDFRKILTSLTVCDMEHDTVEEITYHSKNSEKSQKVISTSELVEKIFNIMPNKARNLKTMSRSIKEAIDTYGYKKVESVALYMKKKKVEKIRSYFLKALENDWVADDKIAIKSSVVHQKTISPQPGIKTYTEDDAERYNKFERLSEDVQVGIENYAYREYVKICGMNSKIQKIAFAGSRKKYICEFLEKHPEILGKKENLKKIENDPMEDIKEIKEMISNSIEMADLLFNYTEDEKKKLLITIIKNTTRIFNSKKLTKNKLEKIINEYIGI